MRVKGLSCPFPGRLQQQATNQLQRTCETTQVAFVDNGQCKLPDKTNAFLYLNMCNDIVWTSMPLLRKIALISGLAVIIQFGYCKGPKKRLREYLLEALAKRPLEH